MIISFDIYNLFIRRFSAP